LFWFAAKLKNVKAGLMSLKNFVASAKAHLDYLSQRLPSYRKPQCEALGSDAS
jgi:hypothetical protein